MTGDGEEPEEGAAAEPELDLEARQLCDDGACTGVVGSDGACRKCGRIAGPPDLLAPPASSDRDAEASDPARTEDPGEFAEERRLCPDGECIGLIGEEGKCKRCGRAAE